jgi:AcrR family transcriptional regulator
MLPPTQNTHAQPTQHTTKRSKGRPKVVEGRDSSTTAQTILQAAKKLFMSRGYNGVSMNDITAQTQVTKPTLYYYFNSKENLSTQVLLDMMQRAHPHILSGMNPEQTLQQQLAMEAQGFFENSPTCLALMLGDARDHLNDTSLATVRQAYQAYILEPFITMFRQAMIQGEIPERDPAILASMVISTLDGMHMQHKFEGIPRTAIPSLSQTLATLVLQGCANSPSPSSASTH